MVKRLARSLLGKRGLKKPDQPPVPIPAPAPVIPPLQPIEKPKPTDVQVFTDVNTGKPTGVTLPDGRTYFDTNYKDINEMVARQQAKQLPAGAVSAFETGKQTLIQRQGEELAKTVGQFNPLTPEQNNLNYAQAARAGTTNIIPYAAGAAATGAAAGLLGGPAAPVTVPLFAGIGAAAGGVSGFTTGFIGNLKSQYDENLNLKTGDLSTGTKALRVLVTDTNRGGDRARNKELFDYQLSLIDQSYEELKMETSGSDGLTKWLGKDGRAQLQKFENFYSVGGMRDYWINEMQQALLNPDPNKALLNISDLES